MSEDKYTVTGTPEEIESKLENLRQDLTETVDQLSARLRPASLIADAKATVLNGIEDAKDSALKLVEDAKNGDSKALKTLAIAGGVTAGLAGLIAWRRLR